MHFNLKIEPDSLNPELTDDEPLSPINLLNGKSKKHQYALIEVRN